MCLLAPTCFGLGSKVIGKYEITNKHLGWAQVGQPGTYDDQFTLRTSMIMITFGTSRVWLWPLSALLSLHEFGAQ